MRTDYFLPEAFTAGKAIVTVRIEPTASGPPWDAAEYRTFSVTPP